MRGASCGTGPCWASGAPATPPGVSRPTSGGEARPGDSLCVLGFQPLVYWLTGARPATRFAFTELPHRDDPGRDGCPWVEQDWLLAAGIEPRSSTSDEIRAFVEAGIEKWADIVEAAGIQPE